MRFSQEILRALARTLIADPQGMLGVAVAGAVLMFVLWIRGGPW